MRYLEGQAGAVQKQMAALEQSAIEISTAINAIQEISKMKESKDSLIPLGAGAFAECSISKQDKLLIDIGSGVVVEKKTEEALKILESRKEEAVNSMKTFEGMLISIQNQYADSAQKLQKLRG